MAKKKTGPIEFVRFNTPCPNCAPKRRKGPDKPPPPQTLCYCSRPPHHYMKCRTCGHTFAALDSAASKAQRKRTAIEQLQHLHEEVRHSTVVLKTREIDYRIAWNVYEIALRAHNDARRALAEHTGSPLPEPAPPKPPDSEPLFQKGAAP